VKPPPDVPARGAAVDSWFLDREKMALAWTGIDDRLVEELG
jgi:hypothetical protein